MIELVDFNEIYGKGIGQAAEPAKKTRRSGGKKKQLKQLLKLLPTQPLKQQKRKMSTTTVHIAPIYLGFFVGFIFSEINLHSFFLQNRNS